MKLKVNEIFYSIQGEGGKIGEASIFIRLAGCNKQCWFCDTDHNNYKEMSIDEIAKAINKFPSEWIVWTGGEPLLQLNKEIIFYFKWLGFQQALETNGTIKPFEGFDYISCSPKTDSLEELNKNLKHIRVNELRFLISPDIAKTIPLIKDLPKADNYYVSPLFIKNSLEKSLKTAIDFVKQRTLWKLSVQQHKILSYK